MQSRLEISNKLKRRQKKSLYIGVMLSVLLIIFILTVVNMGRADIKVLDILKIVYGKLAFKPFILENIDEASVAIVWDIRLPRIITAILVGGGLAVSGVVFQALLMNPLADSYTIGVSTGAAFGAVLAIYFNLFVIEYTLPIIPCAFVGAILTLVLVSKIANRNGYLSSSNLIIAGIIVSSILSSGISLLKSASGEQVSAIVYWLMGSLSARTWHHVLLGSIFIIIGILICIYFSEDLNILCLGERESRFLGVNSDKIRKLFFVIASMITAVCVSISGIIGFVGLVVPHMLRFSLTTDNRVLIPIAALLGGLLLLLADTFSRVLLNVEIPVGVMTTLFGGPFFIYIFIKNNNNIH